MLCYGRFEFFLLWFFFACSCESSWRFFFTFPCDVLLFLCRMPSLFLLCTLCCMTHRCHKLHEPVQECVQSWLYCFAQAHPKYKSRPFWMNNSLPPVFISATASIASPRRLLVILKVKMWLLVVQSCTVESPTDSGAGPDSGPVKSFRSVFQRIRFSLRPRLMGGWAIQVSLVRVNHILRLVSEPSPTVAHVHCVHPKWQAHAEGQ